MKNKQTKKPENDECYYIRTTAIRGVLDPDLGFIPAQDAKEFYVSQVLAVEPSKEKKRWKYVMGLAGAALHKAFHA